MGRISAFAAVRRLYDEFGAYRPNSIDRVTPFKSITASEVDRLKRTPLRELTADKLDKYGFMAVEHWGTDRDYKYFLPRMMELFVFADQQGAATRPFIVCRKLRDCEWLTWPENEVEAVREALTALWWERWMNLPNTATGGEPWTTQSLYFFAAGLIHTIANAEKDLLPYFITFREDIFPGLKRHIAQLMDRLRGSGGEWQNFYLPLDWSGMEEQEDQVNAWFAGP